MAKTTSPPPSNKDGKPPIKVVADNRRARHEFEIIEVYEAGIELSGTEVKVDPNGTSQSLGQFRPHRQR